MHKIKCGLLIFCLVFGLSACGSSALDVSDIGSTISEVSSVESPVSDIGSAPSVVSNVGSKPFDIADTVSEIPPEETAQYAMGYSLRDLGLELVFPAKIAAYPFEETPFMFDYSSEHPKNFREFTEFYPSLYAEQIDFNGGWSLAELHWQQPDGVRFPLPMMYLQAFKKSDIDGGMQVQYRSLTHRYLWVELSKEELMSYLWKETDDYYIIDFSDLFISDYRVFACEAALDYLDTDFVNKAPRYLNFTTYLLNIKEVRAEVKKTIGLQKS